MPSDAETTSAEPPATVQVEQPVRRPAARRDAVPAPGSDAERALDDRLVAATLAGSPDAFRALVERYQRPVLSLIGRMVQDPTLAEDLAQDAFVNAYRRLDTYVPGRKFSSWLFKIAHNRTIDHLRLKRFDAESLEGDSDDGPRHDPAAPEASVSPHRHAEASELRAAVAAAFERLSPMAREVLSLRFEQGLAYQEIADVTGVTLNTVKVRLHRARKALARELEALGVEAPAAFAPQPES
ncbi:MAG: sigma-70 family RNA polymerase sigma factor [Acidobacteriota bacterium]